jgi:CRISPR/Cas system-associated exonuclease Cas4 (RecB family)
MEPGQPAEHKREFVSVTPADEAVVQAQIEAVHGAIRNREFTQGCSQPECAWCQLNA